MLNIALDLITGKATVSNPTPIISGVSVDVQINCTRNNVPSSPGESPVFELALASDAAPAAVLAYLGGFDAQSETEFTGLLDAADTRLVDYMATKASATVKVELRWTVSGDTKASPHFTVPVEPGFITPGETTEGGPVYLTQAQMDARYAQIGVTMIPDRSADDILRRVVIDAAGELAYEI